MAPVNGNRVKKMGEETLAIPRIELTYSPEFKIVYGSGVFGGLHGSEGTLMFFIDRPIAEMGEGQNMALSHIERELQLEVHISYGAFESTHKWMGDNLEKVRLEREKEDKK